MKKRIITVLLAAALLMTACTETAKSSDKETDAKEQVTTTTTAEAETTSEEETEASESEMDAAADEKKDAALNMSFDEVKEALIAAYATTNESNERLANLTENDLVVPPVDKNAPMGIKKAVICSCGSFGDDVIYIQFMLFEMDMESDAYKELKVGGKINYYLSDTSDFISDEPVIAINGQYVLTAYETYHMGDDYHSKPPYTYQGLNYAADAFKALK